MTTLSRDPVTWHDIECGAYTADLELWRGMAAEATGPVLDVGAGTGRVALDLAARGHEVVALDQEPALLDALAERASAGVLEVTTAVGDASGFDLGRRDFALIVVPMQTVQLLAGASGRAGLLASARRHLRHGGRLALALVQDMQPFAPRGGDPLPEPDTSERDGWRHVSQPVAVRRVPHGMRLERRREAVAPDGSRAVELDVIELADLSVGMLEKEAGAAGFAVEPVTTIPETDRHIGSKVVVLRA